MPIYRIKDPATGLSADFKGDVPPSEDVIKAAFSYYSGNKEEKKKESISTPLPKYETPEWAGKYPNLYGIYGAGKELLRTGIESGYTTLGAAGGALVPVPGATLAGAGTGYATGKRVAQSLYGEPVDMTASAIAKDVALGGVLQGAGKIASKIPVVNKIFSPSVVNVGTESATGKKALDKVAYTIAEKSLKAPPSIKSKVRETAINTMLEEEIPITKSGLKKTQIILSDLEDSMDNAIANSPNAQNMIPINDLLTPVSDLRDSLLKTVNGFKVAKKLDNVVNAFKKQYGAEISVAEAQEIKQNTNALLKKSYGSLKDVETESIKQIVRGLKDRIAQEVPEITGTNLRYSHLKTLEPILERAVNRTGNWNFLGLTSAIAGSAVGGATGSVMKAGEVTALARILKSPQVQSRLAIALKNLGHGDTSNIMANAITQSVYNNIVGRNKQVEPENKEKSVTEEENKFSIRGQE